MTLLRAILLVAALTGLGGCSAISALSDASVPLDVYDLRAPDDIPATRGAPLPLTVTIETPTTGGALQTDRIMIRPDPFQAQYLPEVRWSEETPQLVQTLMVRSLEFDGRAALRRAYAAGRRWRLRDPDRSDRFPGRSRRPGPARDDPGAHGGEPRARKRRADRRQADLCRDRAIADDADGGSCARLRCGQRPDDARLCPLGRRRARRAGLAAPARCLRNPDARSR